MAGTRPGVTCGALEEVRPDMSERRARAALNAERLLSTARTSSERHTSMRSRNKRTLSAIAALSATSLGLMTLSPPADAVSGINFTITSNNPGSILVPVDGQGTYFIKHANVGDVLTFTGASATPFSAIAQANSAAGTASIAAVNGAQAFANIGGAVLGAIPANTPTNFTLANYALAGGLAPFGVQGGALDQNVVNAGLSAVVAVADAAPPNTQFAVGSIQFGNQNPNVTTTVTASDSHAGGTVTLGGTHFWGSPVAGAGTPAAAALGIPAPTVLVDGSPVANTASITAADVTPAGALTVGGVLSGSATLPNNLSAGVHQITVIEANTTPYDGNG